MPKRPSSPTSTKYRARVGYEGEYYLVQRFITAGEGFYAVRTPGSGSGKMAKPDIVAVDNGELLAIEVKSSRKKYVMLNSEQVGRLLEFSKRFVVKCPSCGGEIKPKPVLAVRFLNKGWRFIEIPRDWEGSIVVKLDEASPRRLQSSLSQVEVGSSSLKKRALR
ncbi:MAG: Holliday junction resolvase Hjc [Aigarchaeota archaeon]|nr:Holliday junction resolvase Hjc [Aigarchaeota archaeon]MCX8193347.1 Holliday junction resolvase Hjc [Nitrososphaeria archaeon]MDW7985877.1 Holliday junction resolvase Hjc [Nitrososphaerota archaeon]